jgi:hypothetical protein
MGVEGAGVDEMFRIPRDERRLLIFGRKEGSRSFLGDIGRVS